MELKKKTYLLIRLVGKDFERPEYKFIKELLKRTKDNENVLVIKSIDRLR